MTTKRLRRKARHRRITQKIFGTDKIPRLVVFRSNKHIYAQLVDDSTQRTLAASSDLNLQQGKKQSEDFGSRRVKAHQIGLNLAKVAIAKKIRKVVFDRGGYKYHGRVKALADGAREGGLIF